MIVEVVGFRDGHVAVRSSEGVVIKPAWTAALAITTHIP